METENSAGAIIYLKNSDLKYLVLYKKPNPPFKEIWDFPRGNIDGNEKELETVVREVKEETGITYLRFVKDFKESITFFYKKEGKLIRKTITYFLAETNNEDIKLSDEHDDYAWLTIDEALARIKHKNAKIILERAHKTLTS